jgi:hypothetical protein
LPWLATLGRRFARRFRRGTVLVGLGAIAVALLGMEFAFFRGCLARAAIVAIVTFATRRRLATLAIAGTTTATAAAAAATPFTA